MTRKLSLCVLAIVLLFTVVSCKPNPAIEESLASGGTTVPQGNETGGTPVTNNAASPQTNVTAGLKETAGQKVTGISVPQMETVAPTVSRQPQPEEYKGPLVPHSADNMLFYHAGQKGNMENMTPALEWYVAGNSQKMDQVMNALRSGQKVTDRVEGGAEMVLCVNDSNFKNNPYYRNYYRLYKLDSEILFTADHFPGQTYKLSGDKSGVIRGLLEEYHVLGSGEVLTDYSTYGGMTTNKDQGVGIQRITDTTEFKELLARKNMSIHDIDLQENALIRMRFNPDSFSMKYGIARLEIRDGQLVAYANTYAPSGGMIDSVVTQVIYIVIPKKDISKVSEYTYCINDFVAQ